MVAKSDGVGGTHAAPQQAKSQVTTAAIAEAFKVLDRYQLSDVNEPGFLSIRSGPNGFRFSFENGRLFVSTGALAERRVATPEEAELLKAFLAHQAKCNQESRPTDRRIAESLGWKTGPDGPAWGTPGTPSPPNVYDVHAAKLNKLLAEVEAVLQK